VLRLLDDIFYKFKGQYDRSSDLDPSKETVAAKYPWYYLNTYVTNLIDGRVYVVDGQQRLTTLSLMLIKLRHLAKKHSSKLAGWIDSKIAGQSGYDQEFWMNHMGHKAVQQALFEGHDPKAIKHGQRHHRAKYGQELRDHKHLHGQRATRQAVLRDLRLLLSAPGRSYQSVGRADRCADGF
jgi:hypothetical protein